MSAEQVQQEGVGQQEGGGGFEQVNEQVNSMAEILRQTQAELRQSRAEQQELKGTLGKSSEQIDRIRKAFVGDQEKKMTPGEQRLAQLSEFEAYLEQEAEQNRRVGGAGLPVTAKVGKQLAEFARATENENAELRRRLDEIEGKTKRQESPAWQALQTGGRVMEGMLSDALDSLYPGAEYDQTKQAQFNAVTGRIHAEIQDLAKNEPHNLDKLLRNPKYMRNMVNQFMAEALPPKVREMLDEQAIMNEKDTPQSLWASFAEAREQWEKAEKSGDARAAQHWSGIMTQVRQDMLAQQVAGRKGGDVDKPSIAKLMQTYAGGR